MRKLKKKEGNLAKMKNINYFRKLKGKELFSALVVYDATFARLASLAGIDILVVGDSLGMNILGRKTTIPTTIDEMSYHSKAVLSGNTDSFVILDMPAFSYPTFGKAMKNAAKLMKTGGQMIKIEGGADWIINIIKRLIDRGIPICAHIGLTPQYYYNLGGHKIQGLTNKDQKRLFSEATKLEAAGVEMLVLECVPEQLTKEISKSLSIPVLGIGAGRFADGQALLAYDVIGLSGEKLKFTQNFMTDSSVPKTAFEKFHISVKEKTFPTEKHSF